jgi:hypothetical protein
LTYQDLLGCDRDEQKCPYCAGYDDEKSKPIYEKYGMKEADFLSAELSCVPAFNACVDGGFMYVYLDNGYHQAFEISFCPKCGADLRENA